MLSPLTTIDLFLHTGSRLQSCVCRPVLQSDTNTKSYQPMISDRVYRLSYIGHISLEEKIGTNLVTIHYVNYGPLGITTLSLVL